jgi:hypothetical protein
VPVLRRIEGAVAGLSGLAAVAERTGVPPVPAPDDAVPSGDAYVVARALCVEAGVAFPLAEFVPDAGEAVAAAERIGFPVVLKGLDLAHKSDVGGVKLGLTDASAVRDAYNDVVTRLGQRLVVVESMASARGVELIVGARHDLGAGPIVLVGLGGVQAEVSGDVVVGLGPVDRAGALAMLTRLRALPLLTGFRGSAPVDLDAVADVVAAVSSVLARHPEIDALELNPVLAGVEGAVALDAHLEWASGNGGR